MIITITMMGTILMMVIWGADRPSLLWLMLTIVTMPVIELSPLSVNMPRLVDFSVLKRILRR